MKNILNKIISVQQNLANKFKSIENNLNTNTLSSEDIIDINKKLDNLSANYLSIKVNKFKFLNYPFSNFMGTETLTINNHYFVAQGTGGAEVIHGYYNYDISQDNQIGNNIPIDDTRNWLLSTEFIYNQNTLSFNLQLWGPNPLYTLQVYDYNMNLLSTYTDISRGNIITLPNNDYMLSTNITQSGMGPGGFE